MNTAPFYLHAADVEAKPALTLGQGLPPTHNGMACHYFWRPVIADGEYTHPSKGFKLAVDAARRKGWEANFRKMTEAGEKVPVVKDHADDKSDATLGYVVDVRQNGPWLEELHQYLGDGARDVALRNQISVGIDPAYVTGRGVAIGDCIVHSATTPRPVVAGQGEAVPYAAARGGSADVLELNCGTGAGGFKGGNSCAAGGVGATGGGITDKDPATMTAAQLNSEAAKLDKMQSELTDKFIAEGRGNERPSDRQGKADPLSVEAKRISSRLHDLRAEAERRTGKASLPMQTGRGFGPRKKTMSLAGPFRSRTMIALSVPAYRSHAARTLNMTL